MHANFEADLYLYCMLRLQNEIRTAEKACDNHKNMELILDMYKDHKYSPSIRPLLVFMNTTIVLPHLKN